MLQHIMYTWKVLLGNNTGSDMDKTCLAKLDWVTPIRDVFPISTIEMPRQEQVDMLECIHALGP